MKKAILIAVATFVTGYIGGVITAEYVSPPWTEEALAAETKLEACEAEIGIMEKLLAAKMDSLAECDAILKNALMDCGAQAEAKARRIERESLEAE
jgi:hypothetical protein